jgi:hypothetical protein
MNMYSGSEKNIGEEDSDRIQKLCRTICTVVAVVHIGKSAE